MDKKYRPFSIKQKLVFMYLAGLLMALVVFANATYRWYQYHTDSEFHQDNADTVHALILSLERNFLIQRVEWKNIMLRSQNAVLYNQHLDAFKKSKEKINTDLATLKNLDNGYVPLEDLINEFVSEYNYLSAVYTDALALIERDESVIHIDKYFINVYGDALALLEAINLRVIEYNERFHEHFESRLKSNMLIILMLSFVAFVILTMAFWNLVSNSIIKPLSELTSSMDDIAHGDRDLTVRLHVIREDELGKLATFYNLFMDKIQQLMMQIVENANNLTEASNRSAHVTSVTTETIRVQQTAISNVANSMGVMAETVHVIAENASDAAKSANDTKTEAEQGLNITVQSTNSISELSNELARAELIVAALAEKTKNIGSIVGAINEISDQTNLLALNAAIEAARAGEHGRGFAVVADEVRTLAAKTQGATVEVQEMIQAIQYEVNKAVDVMGRSLSQAEQSVQLSASVGEALKTIMNAVTLIEQMNQDIAERSEQQSKVAVDINNNINDINQSVEKTLNTAQQSISDNSDLAQLSMVLQSLIYQFKITEEQVQAGLVPMNQAYLNDDDTRSDDNVELF
jgi:methyl-accepting chemotaxis protein